MSTEDKIAAPKSKLQEMREMPDAQLERPGTPPEAVAAPHAGATRQLEELTGAFARINRWLVGAHEDMLGILNRLPIGVILVNADGCVSFLNQSAEKVFDRDCPQALGQPWEKLLPLQDRDKIRLEEIIRNCERVDRRIPIQWVSPGGRKYRMEIEVETDPRDSTRKIFFIYDASEVSDLENQLNDMIQLHGLCGRSRAMQAVYEQIRSLARVDSTVLIEGETGTGKELVARALHLSGPRKNKPFLAINCAGLTESLLTSQLFGHKKGSFTGAVADQRGLFEAAHGGTLFLDEIGDIPIRIQCSLLRVLQEKEIMRLGETEHRKVDVRIIAATNCNLARAAETGSFRQDLFYRIRVAKITLPPLRERTEDIEPLVVWLLGLLCPAMGLPEPEISAEAMEALTRYHWPGNVRELKSAIESALIRSKGAVISPDDLPSEIILASRTCSDERVTDDKEHILAALAKARGNRTKAASLLGMSRATFYRTLDRLNIRPAEWNRSTNR